MLSKNLSFYNLFKRHFRIFGLAFSLLIAPSAMATIVQFQTVMGDFQVNLYDKNTPKTVENFLAYVKAGAYSNTVIHRAIPGFIVQGGGFKYDTKFPLVDVVQNAAVINEPVYANKRGTIAMAKVRENPNSATNQWFFNVADNSSKLDAQNSGFTVFGEVMGNGMAIVDAMVTLNIFNLGSNTAFTDIPLRNYTSANATNNVAITDKNLVMILNVVVLDANVDTAANLNPTKTTYTPNSGGGSSSGGNNSSSDGGGGSINLWGLLLLAGLALPRLRRK
ncbi:peptidylprolyl isomerase [Cellvibrio sp.]|uniref:peptidylprolyl isomerase n=1 Tax=Cellvibrio sp. TaxID=1965322 RepID=UPI0039648C66